MNRRSSIMRSKLDEDIKIKDIIADKIIWAIRQHVDKPPWITWVSVYQIIRGGQTWNDCPSEATQAGIMHHMGLKQPSYLELQRQTQRYGYSMRWPPGFLENIIKGTIRRRFIVRSVEKKEWKEYDFFWGLGYIRPDGTIDPQKTRGISGYFIYRKGEEYVEPIREFFRNLNEKSRWLAVQWWRNFDTRDDAVYDQIESGRSKAKINQLILENEEYKKIVFDIDPALLTWRKDPDIEDDDDPKSLL